MRKLYVAQEITVSRTSQQTTELLLEAVRKHFLDAISQEKGRLATFNFARRPLDLPASSAGDAEQTLTAADVFDLATLRKFRQQRTDLPSEIKDAILSLEGGRLLNMKRLRATATSLGVFLQTAVQYPGGKKKGGINDVGFSLCLWNSLC